MLPGQVTMVSQDLLSPAELRSKGSNSRAQRFAFPCWHSTRMEVRGRSHVKYTSHVMNVNSDGRHCPNGAAADQCLCSSKAALARYALQREERTRARRKYRALANPASLGVAFLGACWVGLDYWILRPRPMTASPWVVIAMMVISIRVLLYSLTVDTTEVEHETSDLNQIRCALNLLMREREQNLKLTRN